jgi:hypothetical protein
MDRSLLHADARHQIATTQQKCPDLDSLLRSAEMLRGQTASTVHKLAAFDLSIIGFETANLIAYVKELEKLLRAHGEPYGEHLITARILAKAEGKDDVEEPERVGLSYVLLSDKFEPDFFVASDDKDAEAHVEEKYNEDDGEMNLHRLVHIVGWK